MLTLVLVSALNLTPGITLADNAGGLPRIRLVRDDEDEGDKRCRERSAGVR
jgi:hypothetical protein